MAAGGPSIVVKFLADTSKLVAGVDKVEGQGGRLKKFASGAAFAGATAGAVAFGKASIDAATESAQATARLEQIFASMGDTTGDAAKQAENYAGALSKKIGVDDEAIMAAQAQLATFGAVSDETARTAGIFDRATGAAADLAAAGFGSLDSNAVALGKALQNPTKGITALARSGVTFTQSQKDQIAAMEKSGDLLGAQKIVLKAVEGQVKGTAAATATSQQKAAVAFGETQEVLGQKLLPVVKLVADMFSRYSSILIPLGAVIVATMVATKAYTLATNAAGVATKLASAAQWLWNTAMSANPIMLVVLAIVALVAGVILAYQKVAWFRDMVQAMGRALVIAWRAIVDAAKAAFNWIKSNWPLLLAIITGPIGIAVLLIVRNWDTIKNAAKAAFEAVKGAALAAWHGVSAAFGWIKDAATSAWRWTRDKFDDLVGFFRDLPGRIGAVFGGIADTIAGPFRSAFRSIASLWNNTVGALRFEVPSFIPGIGGKGWDVPDIPTMAAGGITRTAGLAYLHPAEVIAPLSSAAAVGARNYYITVEVPPGASPYQVGAATVDAIRSYERVAGADWRK